MISLASIYRKGDTVEQDYTKVLEWYRKAIKEGSTVAQNSLESLYNNKSISVTDSEPKIDFKFGLCSKLHSDISNISESADLENLKTLATHCKRGDGHAMFDIGKRYSQGNGLPKDNCVAFKWIKKAAKAGLIEARHAVSQMYKNGDGIDQDYYKASTWYIKAAKARDSKAQYELGSLYYHGLGVRKDPLEASKWYTFAAEKNNSDAQCQLGILRERGEGLSQDTDQAANLYNEAIKQKNPCAIYKLGQMYEAGGGLETNVELSMKLVRIAARLGSLDAQLKLAEIYGDVENQCYDTKESLKYYQKAAEQDSAHAKYKLAIMYLDGRGTSQDLIKAYYLFKESSGLGYSNAINIFSIPINYSKSRDIDYIKVAAMFVTVCKKAIDSLEYNIGHLYSKGFVFSDGNFSISFTADPFQERAWYERAVNKGNPRALYELGISYESKNTTTKTQNLSKAIDYLQRAYVIGNSDATYKLAYMYLYGHGIPQDLKKAFNLLNEASNIGNKEAKKTLNSCTDDNEKNKHETIKKMLEISAESGHVLSQYKLGLLSLDAKSPYYNIKNAIKWFKMASTGGFVNAHYNLGLLLESVLESDNPSEEEQKTFISFYRMAADKGHEQALFRLAQLYQNGVNRDYVESFRLYTLASQQEYQPAQLATYISSELMWKEKINQLHDDSMFGRFEYPLYLRMWEAVADQGNVEIQFNLGMMHEEVGTDSSLSEAVRWYSRGAECSHTLAIYHLGRLYEAGRGVHQDYLQAIKYYKIARHLGNNDALYQLGIIYQYGKGVSPDISKAINYYTQAAEKGSTMAQFTLGQLFEEENLVSKNILEAVKWYSISNTQGNDNAHDWLCNYFDEGYSVNSFYKRQFYIFSQIVEVNSNKSRRHKSELLGEVNYKLGLMYLYGYGAEQGYKKALKCFRESTKLCDNDTARFFSEIIYKDIPVSLTEDYLKKVDMFETVMNELDLEDIYELGLIYYHGVNSISEASNTNETRVIIASNRAKSSEYFGMIIKGQFTGKINQK
jgi:TPR repeat protein